MSERILVVEDDEFLRDTLATELELAGYRVVAVPDGLQAIEAAREAPFDLVVTDVRLPGLDGLSTLSRMRELQPQVRSIVITGFADAQAPVTAIKLKVDDYLQKPFTSQQLLDSVRQSLQQALDQLQQSKSARRLEQLLERTVEATRQFTHTNLLDESLAHARRLNWVHARRQQVQLVVYLRELGPEFPELRGLLTSPAARLVEAVERGEPTDLQGDTPWQLLQLAEVYREAGQPEVAERALKAVPDLPETRLAWARLRHSQGRLEEARQHAREASLPEAALLLAELTPQPDPTLKEALEAARLTDPLWTALWLTFHADEPLEEAWTHLAQATPAAWEMAAQLARQKAPDLRLAPLPLLERLLHDAPTEVRLKVIDALAVREEPEARALLAHASRSRDAAVSLKSALLAEQALEVRLLGGLQLGTLADDQFKTKKTRNLLAFLCLQRGRVLPEDVLLEAFWPHAGDSARHSLHNSISQLRKALKSVLAEPLPLKRSGTGYVLEPDPRLWVDWEEFQRHCDEARRQLAEGKAREAAAELRQAEDLYRGDLLEGVYEEWTESRRLDAQNRFLDLLAGLARYYHQKERPEVALEYWRKVLQRDDCAEEAYLGMMQGYAALGKTADAVRVYRQASDVLRKQLNLSPSPAMVELYLGISSPRP